MARPASDWRDGWHGRPRGRGRRAEDGPELRLRAGTLRGSRLEADLALSAVGHLHQHASAVFIRWRTRRRGARLAGDKAHVRDADGFERRYMEIP